METPDINEYMTSGELLEWAVNGTNLCKSRHDLTDREIAKLMRWIGGCAADTVVTQDGIFYIRRMGIGLMLTMTLLEFPEYYVKYELAQFN